MKLVPTSDLNGAVYLVRTVFYCYTFASMRLICFLKDQKGEFARMMFFANKIFSAYYSSFIRLGAHQNCCA
jgi:hypothetical protein